MNEKYLAALKSVVNCLEGHKIDFVKLLPVWQLSDLIINWKKNTSDANRKIEEKVVPKRKVEKNNSSKKVKIPEARRSRFIVKDPSLSSPSVIVLQERRNASHVDGNSYDGSLTVHLPDSRPFSHSNNYGSSVQVGPFAGSLQESSLGGTIASNMLGALAGAVMSARIGTATSSFSECQGDMVIDNVGTRLTSNGQLYRWHGAGEGALCEERSFGQSPAGQPVFVQVNDLYGLSTTIEGIAGLGDDQSIGVANHSGGSDL